MKSMLGAYHGLFVLKAFTKSYGMAGLRLGYCLSADKALLTAMGRSVQPWNVSLPAQKAGVAALCETGFLEKTRVEIQTQRRWLQDRFAEMGFYVCPAQANYLLLYHKVPIVERLAKKGILVRDCSNYHGLEHGWLRVAVRKEEENRILIDTIESILRERV